MESTKRTDREGTTPEQDAVTKAHSDSPEPADERASRDPAIELTDVVEEVHAEASSDQGAAPGPEPSSGEETASSPAEAAVPSEDAAASAEKAAEKAAETEAAESQQPAADEEPEELEVVVGEEKPPEDAPAALLAAKEEELARLHDRFLRLAADFDNYKKRVAKDRAEMLKFANENLARQLLEVGDNLERALAHAESSDKQALLDGVALVQTMFLQTLEKFGIKRFSALGEAFDPGKQEAIQEVHSQDLPAGAVVFELHKGYTYHERLLRPARVVLSKGPPPAEGDQAEEGAGEGDAPPAEEGGAAPADKQDQADS